jgi:hypothetical protein
MEISTSSVFTQIPCCACSSHKRDRVLTILGGLFLLMAAGEPYRLPTYEELMRGCCQRGEGGWTDDSVTFLKPSRPQRGQLDHW